MLTHIVSKLAGQTQPIEAKPQSEWRHGHGVMHDLSDGEFLQIVLGPSGLMVHDGRENHLCIPLAEIIAMAQSANPKFKPDPTRLETKLVRIEPKKTEFTPPAAGK